MIAALLVAWNIAQLWRDTNSHASTSHGVKAFAQRKYADAVKDFASANSISPSPRRAFNLGTAQIAAGNREQGSATLGKAMHTPELRADALFNRGNSALASSAYDYAIRDYADVLRLRPNDPSAKRNLEIALARRSQQQQRRSGGSRYPQQGSTPHPQKQNTDAAPNDQQKKDADVEALLRSVQQQEQEELTRMHRARGEKLHVGW